MKYDWLPLAEDNYNRRWQASDAILIISVDIYSGIAHISMTIEVDNTNRLHYVEKVSQNTGQPEDGAWVRWKKQEQ